MGAVKKHLQKFLAAFLCVGMLLSYNPAFGAVDSAFADETADNQRASVGQSGHLKNDMPTQENLDKAVEASGNADDSQYQWDSDKGGQATTEVHVSTFNSTLTTARCDSFSATVDQLAQGSASGKNVSYLWYEVTGGTPSEGADPYNATWTAYLNDEPDAGINTWMKNHPIKPDVKDNVANYHLDIQSMAQAGLLLPNKKYTFVGVFEDSTGSKAMERVTVYTVNDDIVDFQHKVIKGTDELIGVEIEGMVSVKPKVPELVGGKVPSTNPIKDAMEEKAAQDTMNPDDDGNYVVKDVLQINTDPMYISTSNGLNIPPFDEDGFILRLQVDPDSGYGVGDTVKVLWSGDDSGNIVELEATVREVPGEPGKLQVEIPYPYSGDENNDGVDDTGWPPLPGYFAIQYDTNKASGGSGSGDGKAEYFTITSSATGNGIVTPEGTKVWRVNPNAAAGDASLTDTSALAKAMYGFSPMGMGDKAYQLIGLTLSCQDGVKAGLSYNLLDSSDRNKVGATLSSLNTTLTLNNDKSVFSANSVWTLTATFGEGSAIPDGMHKLSVESDNPAFGKVAVAYYNASHELAMKPNGTSGNTDPAGSIAPFDVLNSAKATIVMVPSSPTDKKYYQVTGISMSVGGGSLEPQALSKPFVVPATDKDVRVVVSFGEFTKVPGWGGTDNYKVTATVADDERDLGSVMKTVDDELVATNEYAVEYGENSTFVPNIVFQGVDDDKYLSSVDVYIGDRMEPERVLVNAGSDPLYTLILPNYHANLRVVGHFTDKKASTITLSIRTTTVGEADSAGGGYSTLAWTLPDNGKVRSGQRCPILIMPNDGYVLAGVTQTVGDKTSQTMAASATLGNVLNYVVPQDDREDKSTPLPIVLTINFKKADNGDVDPAAQPPVRVNTYVADATLTNNDFNLGYAFQPEAGKFFVNDESADAATAGLSPAAYSSKAGTVNGRASSFDTVKYGANLVLNPKGGTLDGKRYGIQKILVVKYRFVTEDGVQVKKGISWRLYNTTMPVFELTNITAHTDVIAYFAEVGEGEGKVPDNGFSDKDYCTVKVTSTPEGLVWPSAPEQGVQVLKGSSLPVKFTMSNAEYVIDSATRTTGSSSRNILPQLKDAAGSASTVNYTVDNVTAPTTIAATYKQKPEDQIVRHGVSTNILVKGLDDDEPKPLEQGASQPGRVSVLFGSGYDQSAQLVNGTVPGVRLTEGTDLRFAISRTSSYNKLTNLKLTWDDETVKAYIVKTTVDGVEKNTIYFTNDEADLVGRQLYTSDTQLYADGTEPANVRTEQSWYVSNLLCDIVAVPTYEKLPRPETPDTGDDWILTTLVGTGFGQVLVNDADATGCITKVPKTGEGSVSGNNPLKVSFVPGPGYYVKDLHIDAHSDDLVHNFWAWVQGFVDFWFGDDTNEKMKQQAIENKMLTLQRMENNYTITVDFAPIPEQTSPGTTLTDHVAVNVMYDPEKGSVTPATGLVVNRYAQQQFTVKPKFEMDDDNNQVFYSVTGVRVCFGDDIIEQVDAIENGDVVQWNSKYYNVFTVDFSKIQWPPDQPDAAITVEVLFSDDADNPQADGAGEGDVPGTPKGDAVKQLTVNVVTEGESLVGSNGIGGIVSPLGTMDLVPSEDGKMYKQRVDVLAGDDYEFDHLDVMLNGEDIIGNPRWFDYMYMLKEDKAGYIEVPADEPGTEVITVYFKLKPESERSYTITMGANVPDADSFIQPVGATTLLNTQSQSYSIDPDLNFWVASISDVGIDADGNEVELPKDADGKQGANWTRDEGDEQAINEVTINPIRVNGKALNRRVVVTFEKKDGVDHGIVKSEKVNLHVGVYGPGKEYLTFDPAGDMLGVFKGTDKKHVSYTYSYSLSEEGIDAGYGIYRVTANGETVFGSPDNRTDIKQAGSFVFDTDNMTRETNSLYVYVRKAKADDSEGPGTGDTPNPPNPPVDPDNPNPPDNPGNKYVTVDYGCGNGGTIADKNPSARVGRAAGDDATSGQLTGSLQVDPEDPFVLLITPKEGYVVDKIIMDNCYVIDRLWTAPDDDRDANIALEATMMVDEAAKPARVLATFVKGDPNTFKPWDPTLETGHTFTVDGKLEVEISPADGVEALIEFENDDARAADILDVSNPVAAFTPKTTKKLNEAENSASYTITYDTISKLSEENNVRIVVGPLINWNDDENEKSKLYAIDTVDGLKDVTITEQPLPGATVVEEGETEQPYYTYYEIRGTVDEEAMNARNVSAAEEGADSDVAALADERPVPKVRIGLRNVEFDKGFYPEYMTLADLQTVLLRAQVVSGFGSIMPTAVTVGTSWFDGNLTGPWKVAPGTTVSFKVEPSDGYVLTGLSYDNIDALSNGSFNAESGTLTFRVTNATTVYAEFVPRDSADALRTVTIEVAPSKDGFVHGSTSPDPGPHKVEKGKPFQVTFKADDGYIPYLVWVDGQGSYVAPTLSGWMLPAWWHDQTFRVQYEPVGTDHNWLDDAGLGLSNGTSLVRTGLVQTGDNPWLPVIVLMLLLAGGAAFGGMRLMRAGEAAGRAAKYSVTRRSVPTRSETEPDKKVEEEPSTSDEE